MKREKQFRKKASTLSFADDDDAEARKDEAPAIVVPKPAASKKEARKKATQRTGSLLSFGDVEEDQPVVIKKSASKSHLLRPPGSQQGDAEPESRSAYTQVSAPGEQEQARLAGYERPAASRQGALARAPSRAHAHPPCLPPPRVHATRRRVQPRAPGGAAAGHAQAAVQQQGSSEARGRQLQAVWQL